MPGLSKEEHGVSRTNGSARKLGLFLNMLLVFLPIAVYLIMAVGFFHAPD